MAQLQKNGNITHFNEVIGYYYGNRGCWNAVIGYGVYRGMPFLPTNAKQFLFYENKKALLQGIRECLA